MPKQKQIHQPVLLTEVIELLSPKKGESFLDLTAGYGGHASAVLEHTKNPKGAVLVDRDQNAIDYLRQKFGDAQIVQGDFLSALEQLKETNQHFDMILADLGVSSPHLENAQRGFSFKDSGPLDMRMDQNQALDAYHIVNTYSEKQLAQILASYGEEPKARQISRQIVQKRPLKNTSELAAIVARAWPGYSKVHPATRTFQALRITVNDELRQLEKSLPVMLEALKPGGRLAIVSFHSLEDRIVKDFFAENSSGYDAQLVLKTKKTIACYKNRNRFKSACP